MLLIADRGFAGFDLWRPAASTGADLLWRVKNAAVLPVVQQLGDGSYLSHIYAARDKHRHAGPATVRVIEYTVAGTATVYRLITTILDPAQAPALDLARPWHRSHLRVGRARCLLLLLCWAGSAENSLPWGRPWTV